MTGRPFIKTRVLISHQFVSPLSGRKDFDEAALSFRKAVIESIRSPRLNAELSAKSASMSGSGGNKKNYENTDGKTRTNTGAPPGLFEKDGYRFKPGQKREKGQILQLFPTQESKESLKKTINFGWIDDPSTTKAKEPTGRIRIRKFKVNPRTQEAIPESEVEIDPMGNPVANMDSKQLPGNKIGQTGNLLSRAAGAAGIVVDELGKMRCPPGTPAANQFTDHMGTNCFGLSAGNLINAVQKLATRFAAVDKLFTNNEGFFRSLLDGIELDQTTGSNFTGQRILKRLTGRGRTFWDTYRGVDGEIIPGEIPQWSDVPLTGESRWFVGGMRRAQERLKLQDTRVSGLMDLLGIIRTPETKKQNADVVLAFQSLQARGMWEGELLQNRPSHAEVLNTINKRLNDEFPGFSELDSSVQDSLRNKDVARYYENERAMLEAALESFVMNPEHTKQIVLLKYGKSSDGSEAYATAASFEGEDFTGTAINIDIFQLMSKQESIIPSLAPDERLRIDVVGASTDAEAASQLADFLVAADVHSKQLAAMVEPRGYARHVMKHEIAHTIQIAAFQKRIRKDLAEKGFIEITDREGKVTRITDIKDLTSAHVFDILENTGDGIDSESLGSVMSKLENVKFLAGKYPTQFEGSGEIWVMEATAELHALRDMGIIYGDDVDAVLEWMDDVTDGRHTDRRIRSDIETMKIVEDSYYLNPSPSDGIPTEMLDEQRAREIAAQREYVKQIKKGVLTQSEDEIITEIANLEIKIENQKTLVKNSGVDSAKERLQQDLDFMVAEKNAIEYAWKKKYGLGVSGEKRRLSEKVKSRRAEMGTLTPKQMEERSKALKATSLAKKADSMSPDELINEMVDYELKMRQNGITDADRVLLRDESKIFRDKYKSLLSESGDTRGWPAQRRELETKIDEKLRPTKTGVIKNTKSFKNNSGAVEFGNARRKEHLSGKTERQIDAVQMLSDTEFSSAGQLLDPEKQKIAADAITKRHQRLKKLGLPIDPTSRESGSVEDHIENIIIPSMEVMDDSFIGDSIEVETIMDIDVDLETGQILESSMQNDIIHDGFVSGRVVSKNKPSSGPLDNPEISSSGKKKHRVIIQTTEKDRGMFPHWSMDVDTDDKRDQKLIMPPGKMRIVGRKDDGTLVLQIIEQKNTEDVLSSLTKGGPDGKPWNPSTHKRIEKLSDEYIIKRRDGSPFRSNRPIKSIESEERSILAKREILSSGGSFGEPPSDDYIDEIITKIPSEPDSLGALTNRSGRKTERLTRSGENISELKKTLSSGVMVDAERIDMDPQVKRIISEKDSSEIIKMIEDAAVEMHSGFDPRPRARMREQELDELSAGTQKTSSISKVAKIMPFKSNRAKRRRIREALSEENQKKTATEAALIFNELKSDGLADGRLHEIGDEALLRDYNLVRSTQKSVTSDDPIYKTDSADQAIALLALGYKVEVRDDKTRKMVKNSAFQTEKELKSIAEAEAKAKNLTGAEQKKYIKDFMENHDIDLCRIYEKKKNAFCSKNIGVVRAHMPQSQGPTTGAESPAMRAARAGLIQSSGFEPISELSDADAKRFKDIAKRLGKQSDFAGVSEEDRKWLFENANLSKVEAETTPELMEFLEGMLGKDGIVQDSRDPEDLYSTQKQLKNFQVDKGMKNMLHEYLYTSPPQDKDGNPPLVKRFVDKDGNDLVPGSPEFLRVRKEFLEGKGKPGDPDYVKPAWFQGAILTSRDGQIVDGHHRWASIKMLNDNLPEGHERIKVQVNELQTSIFESLMLTKVFQESMGIKGKTVGKDPFPYKQGDINPMSKEEFDAQKADIQKNFKTLAQEITDKKIYPVRVDDLEFKKAQAEPRSPGLKASRDRPVHKYGMEWSPEYSEVKAVEASKKWDGWDSVPLTELDLSSDILPTESHVKGSAIDSVVSGEIPFREGYHPHIVIDVDGKMYVSDGHNRIAMNRELGNQKIKARIIDLRKVEEPWKSSSAKRNYNGYDLVEPDNPMPEAGKHSQDIVDAAVNQRKKLESVEKEITETLIDIGEKHNSVLVGLKYRFKSVKAMARKIDSEKGNRSAKETAESMSDVIRYTMTYSPENYVAGAKGVIDELKEKGYALTVKNYWKSGDPYQGINIAAVHPDGTRFELQFHTPQSVVEKEVIHKFYEEYRTTSDPVARRKIYDRMTRLAERIGIPADEESLYTIGEIRTQEYEDFSGTVPEVPTRNTSVAPRVLASGRVLFDDRRDKINRVGPIDRLVLLKDPTGNEARKVNVDTSSLSKPTPIKKDEYFKIVGEVAGIQESDKFLAAEKLTSSRVQGLEMYRGIFGGKYGEKNRVFATYTTPKGDKYTISNDPDGLEGVYQVFRGEKRLDEKERVGKLKLLLNDGKMNVHDLYSIIIDEEDQKSGIAQAMVEVAKADFPDARFTVRRVVTDEGAQFAQNVPKSRTPGKNNASLNSGKDIKQDMAVGQRTVIRKGSAIDNFRREYQSRIGIHEDTPESARPVSGYLVHKSHMDKKKNMVKQSGVGNYGQDAIFEMDDIDVVGDGLTALGEIEVVLRPEVGSRTAYGIGESINTAHRPVMLNSTNRDDISDALTNTHGVESKKRNVDSMIHLLSAGIDKDFSKVGTRRDKDGRLAPVGKMDPSTDRPHEPFEAQILGGFKKDDVEGIHYPFSKIQKLAEQEEIQDAIPEKTITAKLSKLGFTKEEIAYFYSMSNGQPLTGASVQRLKEYRAAKKIKQKYESQGIGYVKFAHPNGVNIESPKTYSKFAKGNEDVEKLIVGQILSEMEESLKKTLTKMRKNKANSLIGDPS